MTRALTAIARAACHKGAWLFAACDAHNEGREVQWFSARGLELKRAARRAA